MSDFGVFSAFYFFAALMIVFALLVVTAKDVVHSGVYLLVSMLSVAGLYILLNAEFLAAVQIFIYAGAVTVLVLFVVMLTTSRVLGYESLTEGTSLLALSISGALLALLVYVISGARYAYEFPTPLKKTADLGILLFRNYVLPFEVAGIILLVALVGAVVLAGKEH
jgi:NADH-quinone oxidoreductase subunit J